MRQSKAAPLFVILVLLVIVPITLSARTVIHEETFTTNADGWFTDHRMKVQNGRYEFFSDANAAYSWRHTDLADGVLEVDTSWNGGLDSFGYGIIFRLQDEFNYYFFWIAAEGYYIAGKAVQGQPVVFRTWTYSPAIRVRGSNTLSVKMNGSHIAYLVNDTEVFSYTDSSYNHGYYGFYTQKGVKASFDDFIAWKDDNTLGTATPSSIRADIEITNPNPAINAVAWRGQIGKRIAFTFPSGRTAGPVWGTRVYTDDSCILSAAVHSGLITFDSGGRVVIEIEGPQDSFTASAAHGVFSGDYGSWPGSYVFVRESETVPTLPETSPDQYITPSGIAGFWEGPKDVLGAQDMELKYGAAVVGNDLRLNPYKAPQHAILTRKPTDQFTRGYTISLRVYFHSWYFAPGHPDTQYLIELHGGEVYHERFYIMRLLLEGDYDFLNSPPILTMGVGSHDHLVRTNISPKLNQWHTITASYNGKVMRMYLDGKPILTEAYEWDIPVTNQPIRLGMHESWINTPQYLADISVDSVYLYKRALTDYEVQVLAENPNIEPYSTQIEAPVSPQQPVGTTLVQPSQPAQTTVQTTPSSPRDQIPQTHTVFGTYNSKGSFGGSVYLKDIFSKEALPAYIALYPVQSSAPVLYTATNAQGFYRLDLPNGEYVGVVYDASGHSYDLVTGDGVIRATSTMRVHHFKIDNTKK